MGSTANTARLLEQNPTLMRLREIEALEGWPRRAACRSWSVLESIR
jgi:hypothetical protein